MDRGPASSHARLLTRSDGGGRARSRGRERALATLAVVMLLALTLHYSFAQTPPEPAVLFANLEQALAEAPKADFEVAAALATLGNPGEVSVESIYDFVQGSIGYVPYRGALKGPAGVLMDRAGNSLDRALLLKALLEANGNRAIVAHAVLDSQQAATAVAALRLPPTTEGQVDAGPAVQRLATLYGLEPAAIEARFAPFVAANAAVDRAVTERSNYQSAAVLAALEESGHAADYLGAALPDPTELVADHWWVNVEANGGWLDLDPTLADATVGSSIAPAQLRFDLTDLRLLAAVDGSCRDLSCGDRLHRVHVAVVVESWDGEALSETEVAATDLLSAAGPGRAVAFAALPTDWPDVDLTAEPNATAAYQTALLAVTGWRPTLFVDDATFGDSTVGVDGVVTTHGTASGAAGNAGMLGGGIGGMFGGFGGATAGASDENAGAFTAMWLDYTVTAAGAFEATYRREVFDLIGPAARAAGVSELQLTDEQRLLRAAALSGQTEILVLGANLPAQATQAAALGRLLQQRSAWEEVHALSGQLPPATIAERLDGIAGLTTPLERYSQLRGAHLQGVQSAPLVVAYHRSLGADLITRTAFDVVSGAVTALDQAAARPTQLGQGVQDTVIEAVLQEHLADPSTRATGPAAVSAAFSADLAAGRAWRVVADAAELDSAAPDLTADLRARVVADLTAGRLALVPQGGADAVGWWSIDPVTGAVLGIGDRGWGQAMSEYVEQTNIVLQLRTALNQYASIGRCLGMTISLPLQGYSQESKDALAECIFTTVCSGINTAASMFPNVNDWTSTILMATIDALWGGVPEAGYGGFCGALFKRL